MFRPYEDQILESVEVMKKVFLFADYLSKNIDSVKVSRQALDVAKGHRKNNKKD
jgi:hypothetical protein